MRFDNRLRCAAFVALAATVTALAACGPADEGNGGGDPIVFGDAAVDMAPMQEADPLRDYCQSRAASICAWAFECLGGGGALGAFGLGGADEAACAAGHFESCYAGLSDREARGTLSFSAEGGEVCAMRLRSSPCLDATPGTWVGQWQQYEQQWCGNVARGLVPTDGECAIQADCGTIEDACVDGVCRPVPGTVLRQTCENGGDQGIPQPDESCPTGTCVFVGSGSICSVSCAGGRGCGVGGVCILAQAISGQVRPYCALGCAREGDPTCGDLACEPISEESDQRICEP